MYNVSASFKHKKKHKCKYTRILFSHLLHCWILMIDDNKNTFIPLTTGSVLLKNNNIYKNTQRVVYAL